MVAQAYHGREEVPAQPAPSRHRATVERTTEVTVRCNGLLASASANPPQVPRVWPDHELLIQG
jgi:hypothetical protein